MRSFILPVVLLCAALSLVAGCGNKEVETAAPTSLKGQAPTVPTGEVKGTPEQEAAKQKAIQEGPAIEAALKAQQEGHK